MREGISMGNLAWIGSERMLMVNKCLEMEQDEVCQKRNGYKQEVRQQGTSGPRDARGEPGRRLGGSNSSNTTALSRTLEF